MNHKKLKKTTGVSGRETQAVLMRSVELFSGAGGLALGLEQAGFQSVGLFERDADACATLRANRPKWNVVEGDVREVNFAEYGPVDLVAGGPPCQPFSMGGKANGYNDTRDMFPQAVRAVRELKPRAFIFENVRGLLRQSFRNYVEFIRLQLTYPDFPVSLNVDWSINLQRLEKHHNSHRKESDLTYRVTINLADAADFGVPQHRHRVFFVGFRSDCDSNWFFPSPTHDSDSLLLSKASGEYAKEHSLKSGIKLSDSEEAKVRLLQSRLITTEKQRWRTVRDAIKGLGEPRLQADRLGHRFQPGAKSYPGHTGSPLDEPSKALKAGDHGVPGGENMLRYPDGSVRYFTVRESARIQTFPNDYLFTGSWTESMRQLGNAVPVELARCVAASVAEKLLIHGRQKNLQPVG